MASANTARLNDIKTFHRDLLAYRDQMRLHERALVKARDRYLEPPERPPELEELRQSLLKRVGAFAPSSIATSRFTNHSHSAQVLISMAGP